MFAAILKKQRLANIFHALQVLFHEVLLTPKLFLLARTQTRAMHLSRPGTPTR